MRTTLYIIVLDVCVVQAAAYFISQSGLQQQPQLFWEKNYYMTFAARVCALHMALHSSANKHFDFDASFEEKML